MKGLCYEIWVQIALFSKPRDICTLSELTTDSAPLCNDEFLFSKLLWRDFQISGGGKEMYVLLRRFIVSLKKRKNTFYYNVFIPSLDFNNICGYKLIQIIIFNLDGEFVPNTNHPYRRAKLTTVNLMASWKSVRVDTNGKRYTVDIKGPLFGKMVLIEEGLCTWIEDKGYTVILKMERIVKYASKKIDS